MFHANWGDGEFNDGLRKGKEERQKLVDICFELVFAAYKCERGSMSREDLGKWVASQLRQCGFDTEPRGCSWGVLK